MSSLPHDLKGLGVEGKKPVSVNLATPWHYLFYFIFFYEWRLKLTEKVRWLGQSYLFSLFLFLTPKQGWLKFPKDLRYFFFKESEEETNLVKIPSVLEDSFCFIFCHFVFTSGLWGKQSQTTISIYGNKLEVPHIYSTVPFYGKSGG